MFDFKIWVDLKDFRKSYQGHKCKTGCRSGIHRVFMG